MEQANDYTQRLIEGLANPHTGAGPAIDGSGLRPEADRPRDLLDQETLDFYERDRSSGEIDSDPMSPHARDGVRVRPLEPHECLDTYLPD